MQRILAIPAVTAITPRVYLVIVPQSPKFPYVRVQQISQIDEGLHARGAGGVGWARVQVDAVAHISTGGNGYNTVRQLTAAVHGNGRGPTATGVLGWIGAIGPMTIQGIFSILDGVTEFEPAPLEQVRIRRDYQVWFSEDL